MRTTHHVRDSFAHNADHLSHNTPSSMFFAEVVCGLGASLPRTATSQPPNGGNCTIRGATRRRHAVVRLLVVQTPHHYRLFALWGVGVVVEASRGSWTVSWDDDRTQEFTLGASSTKTRMQFGYPNFLQRPKTLQFQRCDFNV